MIELVRTLPVGNELGECVLWDWRDETLWWVDIVGCELYRFDPGSQTMDVFELPERLASFALTDRPPTILGAFETGFGGFTPGSAVDFLARVELANPGCRMNDGRVDPLGRFWAGSMVEEEEREGRAGSLYRFAPPDGAIEYRSGIQISNSLCWDAEGSRMYFADSPTGQILVAPMIGGEPGEFVEFATALPGAHPDGAVVDSEGYLWSAQWGAGSVVRYSPDGEIDQMVEVSCPQPTCVTFGGPDLRQLYVTSARQGLDEIQLAEYPDSGAVFIFDTPYRGVPESICRLS